MNYYLQAESEEALFAALESAGVSQRHYDMDDFSNVRPADLDPEAQWEPTGKYDSLPVAGVDLDVIGTIFKPTGVMLTDEEGNQYPQMEPLDGYHANIRGITEEQAALLPTIAKPSSPVRIWAGD
jgi:hypothetical protein